MSQALHRIVSPASRLVALSLFAAFGFAGRADGQAFTRLISFGDSLSDVGNVNDLTFGFAPGSGYFEGRYSNGSLWVEHLAGDLGLAAVVNSRAGGTDYATGGSRTGSGNTSPFPFINLPNAGTQINQFTAARTFGPDDLVTLWTGANDFLDGQTDASVPATNVRGHVQRLVDAGARNIAVVNLPPIGDTPRFRATANRAVMNARTAQFNALVAGHLDAIGAASTAATLYRVDVAGFFAQALANPAAYGLSNVTQPAMTAPAGTDADEYLFWDEVHPTRAGHARLGELALGVVTARTWRLTGNEPGAAAGAWEDAANWAERRVPDATSRVTIRPIGFDAGPTLSSDVGVRSVLVTHAPGQGKAGTRLTLNSARLTVTDGVTLRGGELTGNGTIVGDVTVESGGIDVGEVEALGRLAITGDLSLAPAGSLLLDFAPGDADVLAVGGAADLRGSIFVGFTKGHVGLPGDAAAVLTYGSLAGTPSLTFGTSTGLAGLRFEPTYGETALTVTLDATEGDADLDAVVGFADLVTLAQHYGQATGRNWLDGDFTFDGGVGFADLVALAQNYGATAEAFAADWALAQTLVPEPVGLAAVLLPLVATRRRRNA